MCRGATTEFITDEQKIEEKIFQMLMKAGEPEISKMFRVLPLS